MRRLVKYCAAAVMIGGSVIAAAVPANAQVGVSVGIGVPGFYGDYDYHRPCLFYRYNDLPVPARCYGYFHGLWGSNVYVDGDFIFRDRDDWGRWRGRDDYRHWRGHGGPARDGGRDWGHDGGHPGGGWARFAGGHNWRPEGGHGGGHDWHPAGAHGGGHPQTHDGGHDHHH